MRTRAKYILSFFLILAVIAMPGAVLSEESVEGKIAALEARVQALEQQIAALLNGREENEDPLATPFLTGDALAIGEGLTFTVNGYETGNRFRYYPAGGFSSTTLSAKGGYRLLCLFVTVDNQTGHDLNATALLDAELSHGDAYSTKARDTFFYLTADGFYAGGLRTIGTGASVEGCMLFAIPEAAENSQERLSVTLRYSGAAYECRIRDSANLLPAEGESAPF